MGPKQVVAPDGRAWQVQRRWHPKRKLRWRRMSRPGSNRGAGSVSSHDASGWLDFISIGDFGGDNPFAIIAAIVLVLGVLLLAWFFLIPLLLALLDAFILLLLAVAGVVSHVVLHRPWQIEASAAEQTIAWPVLGWRRSGQAIDAVARRLAEGQPLPADIRELLPG